MTKNNPDILCPSCHAFSERRFPRLWPLCKCDLEMPEIEPSKMSDKEIEEYWDEAVEKRTYVTLDCTKKDCRCKTRKNDDEVLKRK